MKTFVLIFEKTQLKNDSVLPTSEVVGVYTSQHLATYALNQHYLEIAGASRAKDLQKDGEQLAFYTGDEFFYIWRIEEKDLKGSFSLEGEELGKTLVSSLNTFTFDEKAFVRQIQMAHKTLQQSCMRLIMAAIRGIAESSVDDRNERSVALAKAILNMSESKDGLPLI